MPTRNKDKSGAKRPNPRETLRPAAALQRPRHWPGAPPARTALTLPRPRTSARRHQPHDRRSNPRLLADQELRKVPARSQLFRVQTCHLVEHAVEQKLPRTRAALGAVAARAANGLVSRDRRQLESPSTSRRVESGDANRHPALQSLTSAWRCPGGLRRWLPHPSPQQHCRRICTTS